MLSRIQYSDTTQDALVKMCEGNPGGLRVCMELLTKAGEIDPDNIMGGLGFVLNLDTLGLYGSKIWMLYKDVCNQDLTKTCAILRGWQLGYVAEDDILHAVDNYGDGLNPGAILNQVQETLPNFGGTNGVAVKEEF